MRYALALLTLLLVAVPAAAQTATVSLDDAVRGVESAYGRMTDLKAEFTQTAFNKSLNQTIPASGKVYLKKGGKLRWEYAEPTPQQIVSDGKTIWIYTPTLNQVNTGPAPEALAGPVPERPLPAARALRRTPAEPVPAQGRRGQRGARPHAQAAAAHARASDPVIRSQRLAAAPCGRLRPVREHGHDEVRQPRDQLRPGGQALRVRGAQGRGDRPAEVVRRRGASRPTPPARRPRRAPRARHACGR